MRDAVAQEMGWHAEQEGASARAGDRADGGARRDVERDDHIASVTARGGRGNDRSRQIRRFGVGDSLRNS